MDKPVALGEVTLGEGVDSWNTIIFCITRHSRK